MWREFVDITWQRSLWMRRETAIVSGVRSLQREVESTPMTALSEVMRIAGESDPSRFMVETAILDGDVEDGVGLTLTVRFLVWSESEAGLDEMIAPAHAALADAEWTTSASISAVRPDAAVTELMADAFAAAGRTMITDPLLLPFATDFGNVSQLVPAALIGIGREGGWGFHRDRGVDEFASDQGKELADSIARVVGLATLRLSAPVE
jgi:metal-dependent amidase/aminoacylase/carboxypeptidase family protein